MKAAAPVTIRLGLPLRLRLDAARLIWGGFGRQIAPGLGRRAGIARIRRGLQRERVIVALDASGGLAGLTGLRGAEGGVVTTDTAPRFLGRTAERIAAAMAGQTNDLVLDCLIVTPAWRRQGVAAVLIEAALIEAARRGYPGLRAEVARHNTQALRAYRRAGLSGRYGWLPGRRVLRRSVANRRPDPPRQS